jgi:hypothetical protein
MRIRGEYLLVAFEEFPEADYWEVPTRVKLYSFSGSAYDLLEDVGKLGAEFGKIYLIRRDQFAEIIKLFTRQRELLQEFAEEAYEREESIDYFEYLGVKEYLEFDIIGPSALGFGMNLKYVGPCGKYLFTAEFEKGTLTLITHEYIGWEVIRHTVSIKEEELRKMSVEDFINWICESGKKLPGAEAEELEEEY